MNVAFDCDKANKTPKHNLLNSAVPIASKARESEPTTEKSVNDLVAVR